MRTSASSSVSNTVGVSRREVRAVHVVDGVGQLARDAEALGGAEARAVLDVAVLVAVKPVHRRDLVLVLADAGDDRGGAHGRDRRERGDAVGHVAPALDQPLEHRRGAGGDRALEHRRRHRVDHAQARAWAGGAHGQLSGAGCAGPRTSRRRARARASRTRRAARRRRSRAGAAARRAPRAAARRRRGRWSALRARRGRAGARARRAITGPGRALGERRRDGAAEEARPPGVAVRGERAREQQRAGAEAEAGERRGERVAALDARRGSSVGASSSTSCSA